MQEDVLVRVKVIAVEVEGLYAFSRCLRVVCTDKCPRAERVDIIEVPEQGSFEVALGCMTSEGFTGFTRMGYEIEASFPSRMGTWDAVEVGNAAVEVRTRVVCNLVEYLGYFVDVLPFYAWRKCPRSRASIPLRIPLLRGQ